MADLLTDDQRNQFLSAVKDVTDTFFKTSVFYHRMTVSVDKYQEDNKDRKETTWNLNGLVVPLQGERTDTDRDKNVSRDMSEVTVIFNMQDLESDDDSIVNSTTWKLNMDPAMDFFTIADVRYRVIRVMKTGPLTARDVLVKVTGRIEPKDLPYV